MLAKDCHDKLPQNWFVTKRFNVFVISILPKLCLLASKRGSSLATYVPKMSFAPPLWRVSFKVSNNFSQVSEVIRDSFSFSFILWLGFVVRRCVFWQFTCCWYVCSHAYTLTGTACMFDITKVWSRAYSVWASSFQWFSVANDFILATFILW